mmetsp:Transcript_30611/g.91523  ORF Transcript_30611/g.91523 Transcript_30611/m.91523 type:complete len:384 (+) Transcript_30611:290-1441(+)
MRNSHDERRSRYYWSRDVTARTTSSALPIESATATAAVFNASTSTAAAPPISATTSGAAALVAFASMNAAPSPPAVVPHLPDAAATTWAAASLVAPLLAITFVTESATPSAFRIVSNATVTAPLRPSMSLPTESATLSTLCIEAMTSFAAFSRLATALSTSGVAGRSDWAATFSTARIDSTMDETLSPRAAATVSEAVWTAFMESTTSEAAYSRSRGLPGEEGKETPAVVANAAAASEAAAATAGALAAATVSAAAAASAATGLADAMTVSTGTFSATFSAALETASVAAGLAEATTASVGAFSAALATTVGASEAGAFSATFSAAWATTVGASEAGAFSATFSVALATAVGASAEGAFSATFSAIFSTGLADATTVSVGGAA